MWKNLLMNVKEESEKAGLKLSIHKTKIMASSPITSWQIDGKTMETVRNYIFFSAGQVLLSALSWCSAYTSVCLKVSSWCIQDVLHVFLLLRCLALLSLFFHRLSRFVIAFLPRSKHLLISLASFCCCFLDLYFIYFCSHLYDLFPSTHFFFFSLWVLFILLI